MNSLGEKIKSERKFLNMTQQDLAKDDFTKSYISQIERGIITPSVKSLNIIASRLQKPLSFFIDKESDNINYNNMISVFDLAFDAQALYEEMKHNESKNKFLECLKYKDRIDNKFLFRVYYSLSKIDFDLGYFDESLCYCESALSILKDSDLRKKFKCYYLLGNIYYELGSRRKSLEAYLESNSILKSLGDIIDNTLQFDLLRNIGIVYGQLGNRMAAFEYLNQTIDLSKENNILNEAVLDAHRALSDLYLIEKSLEKCLTQLDNLLPFYKYFNHYYGLSGLYNSYVKIYYEYEDYQLMEEYLVKSQAIIPKIENKYFKQYRLAMCSLYWGKLSCKQNNPIEAEKHFLDALEYTNMDNPTSELTSAKSRILLAIGDYYCDMNRLNESLEYMEKCFEFIASTNYNILLPDYYRLKGKIFIKKGDNALGQEYYEKAFDILKEQPINTED